MRKDSDLDLSALEEMLLTVLLKREVYGLELIQAIHDASEGKRRIGFSSLYPTLHQLEKKGMVKSRWGTETPMERGRARRRYYKITGLGVTALKAAQEMRENLVQWKPAWGRA